MKNTLFRNNARRNLTPRDLKRMGLKGATEDGDLLTFHFENRDEVWTKCPPEFVPAGVESLTFGDAIYIPTKAPQA